MGGWIGLGVLLFAMACVASLARACGRSRNLWLLGAFFAAPAIAGAIFGSLTDGGVGLLAALAALVVGPIGAFVLLAVLPTVPPPLPPGARDLGPGWMAHDVRHQPERPDVVVRFDLAPGVPATRVCQHCDVPVSWHAPTCPGCGHPFEPARVALELVTAGASVGYVAYRQRRTAAVGKARAQELATTLDFQAG